jgi:hypothetical protein
MAAVILGTPVILIRLPAPAAAAVTLPGRPQLAVTLPRPAAVTITTGRRPAPPQARVPARHAGLPVPARRLFLRLQPPAS